jgi:4-hydroxy-3-polyprenylbenzoate decarboxylase
MKIVIGISGASGAIYAKNLITALNQSNKITQLFVVASDNAKRIFLEETGQSLQNFTPEIFDRRNFDVPFVSGSAKLDAMIVVPCSMGTLGRIAHGISDDSLTRAADVFLKEKRKLILVPRDTPFHAIHLQNMLTLTNAGATILPAIPSFYTLPASVDEVANTVVARILDHLQIDHSLMKRWKQDS